MSSSNSCFLTWIQVFQETDQVVWYSHFFQNFPQFILIYTKALALSIKQKLMFFWNSSCFFSYPVDVGNLISGSSTFSKTSLNIWKCTVHIFLEPGLENFEHYFANVWDECNCVVVWAFFGIAFLRDWSENWPFPALWPLLSFPNLLTYWVHGHGFGWTLGVGDGQECLSCCGSWGRKECDMTNWTESCLKFFSCYIVLITKTATIIVSDLNQWNYSTAFAPMSTSTCLPFPLVSVAVLPPSNF